MNLPAPFFLHTGSVDLYFSWMWFNSCIFEQHLWVNVLLVMLQFHLFFFFSWTSTCFSYFPFLFVACLQRVQQYSSNLSFMCLVHSFISSNTLSHPLSVHLNIFLFLLVIVSVFTIKESFLCFPISLFVLLLFVAYFVSTFLLRSSSLDSDILHSFFSFVWSLAVSLSVSSL